MSGMPPTVIDLPDEDSPRRWEELRDALAIAVAEEGSLLAVERVAGIKRRGLKYFAIRQRRDRPKGEPTTLSAPVEMQLRAYLRRKIGWPNPVPTVSELLALASRVARPRPSLRERFVQTLARVGYYEEVSRRRIVAAEELDLLRVYEPEEGLEPEDYFAFAPALFDDICRAELCGAVVENLIVRGGYTPIVAMEAASSLHLGYRGGFALEDDRPDFAALVSEAIANQRAESSAATKRRPSDVRVRLPRRVAPIVPPSSTSAKYLSPSEAACYLQVSRRTLDRLRARRVKLGAIKIGGQVRYDRDLLDEYLRKRADK